MNEPSTSPGLAPLPMEEWSEQARTVLPTFLRRPELYLSGQHPMPQALGLFAHHVELAAAWMSFSDVLVGEHSTLDPLDRELAILRVAWVTGSNYEWKQHVRIGSHAGLTTEQLYAIPDGPNGPDGPDGADTSIWTPLQRAILRAADDIVESQCVNEATWNTLAEHFEPAQLLELMFAIGSYLCFAAVTNSVHLQPDPPTEPTDAPELPSRS